jgi:hypothetical protein
MREPGSRAYWTEASVVRCESVGGIGSAIGEGRSPAAMPIPRYRGHHSCEQEWRTRAWRPAQARAATARSSNASRYDAQEIPLRSREMRALAVRPEPML